MKITISFKANELWIYDAVCKHSGKGNWIKDVLAEYLSNNPNCASVIQANTTQTNIPTPVNTNTSEFDLLYTLYMRENASY